MRRTTRLAAFTFTVTLIFFFVGCQSHQAKVDALQKEYDRLGAEFQKDCSARVFKSAPDAKSKVRGRKAEDRGSVETTPG